MKFNNQNERFINHFRDLSIKLEIYQSNSRLYQSNTSHSLVNLLKLTTEIIGHSNSKGTIRSPMTPNSVLNGFIFAVLQFNGGFLFHELVNWDDGQTIFYFAIFPGKSTKKVGFSYEKPTFNSFTPYPPCGLTFSIIVFYNRIKEMIFPFTINKK